MDINETAGRGRSNRPAPTRRILSGLVGEDIQASRSPWLHEREADAQGIRLIYSLFDLAVTGEGADGLAATLDAANRLGFAGVNITHPFKQKIIPLLDELSDEARRIGAVNTVAFRNGVAKGFNTDCLGFSESLRRGLADAQFDDVVQLGAGGAGAATANALLEHGTRLLRLYDVREGQAEALAANLSRTFGAERVTLVSDLASAIGSTDGVVNATPIGMVGHAGTPIPAEWLQPTQWVADVIYFPLQTELLKQARAKGCRTLNGVPMVVFQAAAAFDIFTGLIADRERMLAGALEQWKAV
ncbi:MAG: shikimate dehydrogenase [Sphingomicrobium sp.]